MSPGIKNVAIYCGSSDNIKPIYRQAARVMGRALVAHDMTLVFGAGGTGMMGTLADAVLEAGGLVIGVIPEIFNTPALLHDRLTELHVVKNMHQRKALIAELSDAFIALPGGFGTFEELFEILTWSQIGLHTRPIGVLNANRYFDPFLRLIEHARSEGFIYDEHSSLILSESQPVELLNRMSDYRPPAGLERWVDRVPAP